MGRVIRKVPPNWEHPKYTHKDGQSYNSMHVGYIGTYRALIDEDFQYAFDEWLTEFERIRKGDLAEDELRWYPNGLSDWLEEHFPPLRKNYRPYREEEATWFQAYENVSEGTPVSPPFKSKEELVDYLVEHGDFWQQNGLKTDNASLFGYSTIGYSRKAAEKFVAGGQAPSFTCTVDSSGKVITKRGIACLDDE